MTTSPHSHITVFVEQISGDRNSIEITSLLSIDPYLRQTVREVARGQNIFDVIVTNLARYFNEPVIINNNNNNNIRFICLVIRYTNDRKTS